GLRDLDLDRPVPTEPRRGAPGPVADVDRPLVGGVDYPLDPAERLGIEITRQHLRDPDLSLEVRLELPPARGRPDGEDVVDSRGAHEVLDQVRAEILLLWRGGSSHSVAAQWASATEHPLEGWRVPTGGEECRVEDDRIERDSGQPPG